MGFNFKKWDYIVILIMIVGFSADIFISKRTPTTELLAIAFILVFIISLNNNIRDLQKKVGG